jgi:hypothetical protein
MELTVIEGVLTGICQKLNGEHRNAHWKTSKCSLGNVKKPTGEHRNVYWKLMLRIIGNRPADYR